MNVAYVRVSTVEQNEERQIAALRGYGIDRWFVEKTSGKDANRAEFRNMLGFVREGDCVFVEDFSRLTRNLKDLLETIERLDEKGVKFVSVRVLSAPGKGAYTRAESQRSLMKRFLRWFG